MIHSSRYIAPHPRPFMQTRFARFDTYPGIIQNIPRPTWAGAGRAPSLQGLGALGEFVDVAEGWGPDTVAALFRQPSAAEAYDIEPTGQTIRFSEPTKAVSYNGLLRLARFGIVGVPLALFAGGLAGYFIGKRRR